MRPPTMNCVGKLQVPAMSLRAAIDCNQAFPVMSLEYWIYVCMSSCVFDLSDQIIKFDAERRSISVGGWASAVGAMFFVVGGTLACRILSESIYIVIFRFWICMLQSRSHALRQETCGVMGWRLEFSAHLSNWGCSRILMHDCRHCCLLPAVRLA